jgi:hypothetical protein
MMSKEWIILYIIILGSVFYLAMMIRALSFNNRGGSNQGDDLALIHASLERIEEEISKFYENELKDGMEPHDQFLREKNPPTIYDIIDELQSISNGIEYIVAKLEDIELSKND